MDRTDIRANEVWARIADPSYYGVRLNSRVALTDAYEERPVSLECKCGNCYRCRSKANYRARRQAARAQRPAA